MGLLIMKWIVLYHIRRYNASFLSFFSILSAQEAFKFRFVCEVRPSLSLRGCVCSRGNLKKQKALEINERSPQSHTLLRDDMRYTIAIQQTDKLEFTYEKPPGV